MAMKGIDYQKILEQLIKEYPHALDRIEKVIHDAKENMQDVDIEFIGIIESNIWNSDEKARLLTLLGYNKFQHKIIVRDKYKILDPMMDYEYTIKYDIFSGFEALMKIHKDIRDFRICTFGDESCIRSLLDESYRLIFDTVISDCKDENKTTYIKAILDNLTVDDIKRLIAPYYEGHYIAAVRNKSIFIDIIASKDLDLIKKYMGYIDNINMYLSEAVATGNIEIVKFFLEKGANINYLTDEVILGRLTPLKTAIINNDYEMAKFLIENGADANLQVNSDDFMNRLNNYQIDVSDTYRIVPVNEHDEYTKQLEYIRASSPLEYAVKLREYRGYKCDHDSGRFDVYFNGESFNVKNRILEDMYDISVKNRGKIVDLIFDKLEDKTSINYSDLICFTFITKDLEKFKKYSRYAIDSNYQIDFDFLFKIYFDFYLQNDKEMLIPFMNLISEYDKDGNIYLKLFDYYLDNVIYGKLSNIYKFYVDDFIKELFNRISEEKRNKICLVPYCRNIDSLEYLTSLGFDINQVDDNGRNILYHLLCSGRLRSEDLTDQEMEFFNYLLENLNLSMKDNNNKTALYYAMQEFNTQDSDSYRYPNKDWVGTKSNLEKAVAILVSRMPKQDVCNSDIKKVLEDRLITHREGYLLHCEFVYQHHKELFDALIDKGFILSAKVLNAIFTSLYPEDEWQKEHLLKMIDRDSTLDFLYKRLDYNLQIQEINIEQEFEDLILYIDSQDITFDEFIKSLKNFNSQIISLKKFYKKNIQKRFNPERYLQYAKEKYNTIYENLDSYLPLIIIIGIRKFGNEKLVDILDSIPNYDINSYIVGYDIGLNYWSYVAQISDIFYVDEDGDHIYVYDDEHFEADDVCELYHENIIFTGGLIQYAILTDNLPMVQFLQKRGANLKFLVDGKDHTWDYVSSYTMLNYIESFVGKKKYSGFDEVEKDYYLDLITPNMKNNRKPAKKLVLKKDD